ncbi:MAG TPA: hypothetical protein VF610_06710, partial [Segetibacter sp.]
KMPYETQAEMDAVVGRLEDNTFIKQQRAELEKYKELVAGVKDRFTIGGGKVGIGKGSVKVG